MPEPTLTDLIAGLPPIINDPNAAPQTDEDVATLKANYDAAMQVNASQGITAIANLARQLMQSALSGPLTMKQRFDALGTKGGGYLTLMEVLTALVKSQRPGEVIPTLPPTHTYKRNQDGSVTATEK